MHVHANIGGFPTELPLLDASRLANILIGLCVQLEEDYQRQHDHGGNTLQ